ncbi:Gag-Pol [Artemisia annua]|uniref:Gag-Pol n=1 Tax=Artemisia annua TaxID=35608 RepID=A0A2U1QCN3_ARTAN|nr:Gag-Pol [Artemisia annua]
MKKVEKQSQPSDSSEAVPQQEVNETTESQAPTTRTLNRERKRPVWHTDYVMEGNVAYCLLTEEGEPSTLQEALNNSDASGISAVHRLCTLIRDRIDSKP